MRYLILIKPDLYKEGIREIVVEGNLIEQDETGVRVLRYTNFRIQNGYTIESDPKLIAFYKLEHVVFAGEYIAEEA